MPGSEVIPKLFQAKACFSPSVSDTIQAAWVTHGGSLMDEGSPPWAAECVFCDGREDPWYPSLATKAIPVFHAQWVVNVVSARFPVPMAPYVLNEAHREPRRAHDPPGGAEPTQDDAPRPLLGRRRTEKRLHDKNGHSDGDPLQTSTSCDEGPSGITLVGEQSVAVEVPYIDLSKVKATGRKSGEQLRISKVRTNKLSSSRPRSRSATLLFELGAHKRPRLSGPEARRALRHVQLKKTSLVKHNAQHLGKTFRCGRQP